MFNQLVVLMKIPFNLIQRRALSPLKVDVQKARVAGEKDEPALVVTVTVENPQGENSFVKSFEVKMMEPFKDTAVRYEFRDPRAESNVKTLPVNVPAFGITDALTVIAHFNQSMASPSGQYKTRIAAMGRGGFRRRYTEFTGDSPWKS